MVASSESAVRIFQMIKPMSGPLSFSKKEPLDGIDLRSSADREAAERRIGDVLLLDEIKFS